MSNKTKKIIGSVAAAAAVAAAATTMHLVFIKETMGLDPNSALVTLSYSYSAMEQASKSNYFKDKISSESFENIKNYNVVLNNKNLTDREKIKTMSDSLNKLAQELSNAFSPNMPKADYLILKDILEKQRNLLRETTLKSNFSLGPTIELEKAFARYESDPSYDISEALAQYQRKLQEELAKQNGYLQVADELVAKAREFEKTFPYPNLKNDLLESVDSLEKYSNEYEFTLNDLETKEIVVQNKLNKLEELKQRLDKKINTGDSLVDKANQLLNSDINPKLKQEIQDAINQYNNVKNNLNSEADLDEAIQNLQTTLLKESDYRKSPEELKKAIKDFVATEQLDIFDDLFRKDLPDLDNLPSDVESLANLKKQINDKYNSLKALEDEFKDLEAQIDDAYDKKFLSDIDKLKLDNLEDKFRKAPSKEEAQKILDEMKKVFDKAVSDSKIMMDELDNLRNDIKWLKDQENLKPNISSDLDELENKIDATKNLGSIPVAELKQIYKAWSNELKNDYLDQAQNLNSQIQALKDLYNNDPSDYAADMLAQIADFDDLTKKLSSATDPITISNLKDAIEKMNDFLTIKPVVDQYIDVQKLIDEKKDHLDDIFNVHNDPNYVPTEVQKVFATNLDNFKKQAETLKNSLNAENADQVKAALEEIARKVQENTEKALIAKNSIDAMDRSDNLLAKANTLVDKPQKEMQDVAAKKAALDAILKDPNTTKEQLKQAQEALSAANDKLANAISEKEQNKMFNDLKKKINETFPNTKTSNPLTPIEKALLDKLDSIKETYARDKTNPENIDKTKEDLAKLEQLLPSLKDLQDTQLKALKPAIIDTEESPNKGAYSAEQLPKANEIENKISDLIDRIKSDNIPNSSEVAELNNDALNEVNALKVAKAKDNIVALNNLIQNNKVNNPATEEENKINEGIKAIDDFVQDALANKNQASDIELAEEKVAAFNPLVDELKKAADLMNQLIADQGNTDKNQKLIDQIKEAIKNNGINLADSPSAIKAKTDALKDFLVKEEAKKELNDSVKEDVQAVLDQIKDKAIQVQLVNDLEQLKHEAELLLESRIATAEEIKAKNDEILAKLSDIQDEIRKNEESYQQKIDKIEALKKEIDPKYADKQNLPESEKPYYLEAIDEYNALKDDPRTTLQDLDDMYKKIQFEFDRDEAIKATQRLKSDVTPNADDSNNPYNELTSDSKSGYASVKKAVDLFTDNVLTELNDPKNTYSNYDPVATKEKVDSATQLFDVQKLVAKKILLLKEELAEEQTRDSDRDKLESDIKVLNDMLSNSLVNFTDSKEDIENKKSVLDEQFEEYKTFEIKRDESLGFIQRLREKTEDAIGAYDPTGLANLNSVYDAFLDQVNKASTLDTFESVNEKVKLFENKLPAITEFAKAVKVANDDFLSQNSDSAFLKSLNTELTRLINEGEALVVEQSANSEAINAKTDEIKKYLERLAVIKEIHEIIEKTRKANKDINYYVYNGQDSEIKKTEVDNWLDKIQQDAFNEKSKDELDKIKVRAEEAQKVVAKYKQISEQIQTYKSLTNTFAGNEVDAKLLIQALWQNTAKKPYSQDKDNVEITNVINNLDNKNAQIQNLNDERTALNNLITEYREDSVNGLANADLKNNHLDLYNALKKRVDDLYKNKVLKSTSLSDLTSATITVDGYKKIIEQTLQNKFIDLSTIVKKAEEKISSNVSTDTEVNKEIESLSAEIKKAKAGFLTFTTNDQISKLIDSIKIKMLKIEILVDYQKIKETVQTSSLSQTDKAPINALLNQFLTEFKAQTGDDSEKLKAIKDKYLSRALNDSYISVTGESDSIDVSKNNIVLQAFEDSKELRRRIDLANYYYNERQQGDNSNIIDTPRSKELYAELKVIIDSAEQVIASNTNDENAKAHKAYELQEKIDEIRTEKLNQVKALLAQTEKLRSEITAQSWSANSSYETKAINDLKAITENDGTANTKLPENITIKDVNLKIYYANKEFENQKEKIWNEQQATLVEEIKKLDKLIDAFSSSNIRSSIDIKDEEYNVLISLKNKLSRRSTFTYSELSKLTEETFKEQYPSDSIDASDSLFTQEVKVILGESKTQIKAAINKFNQIYSDNMKKYIGKDDSSKGIIRDFRDTISPFIASEDDQQASLFKQLGMTEIINIFNNKFNVAYNAFLGIEGASTEETNYNTLVSTTDPLVMMNKAGSLYDLKGLMKELVEQIQKDFKGLYSSRANLNEIITDLSSSNKIDTAYWAINTLYSDAYNSYKQNVDDIKPDFVNLSSKLEANPDETLDQLKARQNEYAKTEAKKIVDTIKQSEKFFTWLEDNLTDAELNKLKEETNTTKFNVEKADIFANKPRKLLLLNDVVNKFTQITPLDSTRYNDFTNRIDLLGNEASVKEIDITNSRELMNLFTQFKFTSKDLQNQFNSDNLRVIIKRRSDASWYKIENQSNDYSTTKVLFDVVYRFTPRNVQNFDNFTTVEFQSDQLLIKFKTTSMLEIQPGRSVFVLNKDGTDKFGSDIKQTVMKIKDTGWNINQTDEELLTQFWNGLSTNIFGGVGSQNSIKISNEDYKKASAATSADQLTGDNNKVAKLIKEGKLGLKISIPVSNSFSGSWTNIIDSNNGRYKVYLSPNEKEMIVYGIYPSKPISQGSPNSKYGDRDLPFKNAYGNLFSGTDIYKAMPQVEVFKWVFKFEIDSTTKEVKSYIKHLESRNFTKVRNLMVDGYNSLGTSDADKQVWTADKFAEFVYKNDLVLKENSSNWEFNVPTANNFNSINSFVINYQSQAALKYILNPQDSVFGPSTSKSDSDDTWRFFKSGIDRTGGILIENGTIKEKRALGAIHWPYNSSIAGDDTIGNIFSIPYQSTIREFKFKIKD